MHLSFHGSVNEVTGSCMKLDVADAVGKEHRLLIDCGMYQGERLCGGKNFLPFGFDPKDIEAVFVTHAHADHTGRLPKLFKEGYAGTVTMTAPTVPLTRLVLEDAFHIMEENARRCGDPVLYALEDLQALEARCVGVGYHEAVEVAPGLTVMFHEAGHILGSAYVSVEAEGKRVVFSGDIGNDEVPILPATEAISRADAVVCESTYGDRVHEGREERTRKLRAAVEAAMARGGTLLIPSFSIERTQELLYELNRLLTGELKTRAPIFLDSPMAIRATQVYREFSDYLKFDANVLTEEDRDFFSFPTLRETLTVDESKAINDVPPPKVIIAGSGMMSGGRVLHHLIRVLPDPKNMVLIIGYQAAHTLGRQIYDGIKRVNVYGQDVDVRGEVRAIGAFSAHGDRDKLTRWVQPADGRIPKKIFLTHGDPDVKAAFAAHLREAIGADAVIPELHAAYEL